MTRSRKLHSLLVLAPLGLVVAAALGSPLQRLDLGCRALGPRQARADLRACAPAASDAECAEVFGDPRWMARGGTGRSYQHGTVHRVQIARYEHSWTRTTLYLGHGRRDALIRFVTEASGAAPTEVDEFGCAAWSFIEGQLEVCAGWMNWTPKRSDARASAAVSAIWVGAGEELLRDR